MIFRGLDVSGFELSRTEDDAVSCTVAGFSEIGDCGGIRLHRVERLQGGWGSTMM